MTQFHHMILAAVAVFSTGSAHDVDVDTVYESVDAKSVLIISNNYFFIGSNNHPEDKDFVKKYGKKMEYIALQNGRCLSFGVFKFVITDGAGSFCQGVRIRKTAHSTDKREIYYTATCFILQGNGCSMAAGRGRPALTYGYKAEVGRGITEIYLSDKYSRNANNTLIIKSGPPIFGLR